MSAQSVTGNPEARISESIRSVSASLRYAQATVVSGSRLAASHVRNASSAECAVDASADVGVASGDAAGGADASSAAGAAAAQPVRARMLRAATAANAGRRRDAVGTRLIMAKLRRRQWHRMRGATGIRTVPPLPTREQ